MPAPTEARLPRGLPRCSEAAEAGRRGEKALEGVLWKGGGPWWVRKNMKKHGSRKSC